MDSAFAWKAFYARERARLGDAYLDALLDAAAAAPPGRAWDALVVPHTRLEITGDQLATAATAVVATGRDRVLALGVLHGARRSDAAHVAAARAGDAGARSALRGVHTEAGYAAEEFSLDAFSALVARAACRAGRSVEVIRRYPFLVGADPTRLSGYPELVALVDAGAALVATADPVHHGRGYGTEPERCLAPHDERAVAYARTAVASQLELLGAQRFDAFTDAAARHRSDFRDTGPVLASLLGGGFVYAIERLALVDYAEVLHAAPPTWVAGALVRLARAAR